MTDGRRTRIPERLVKTLLIINNGLFIFRRDNSSAIRTAIFRSNAPPSRREMRTPGSALRMYGPNGSEG
jgi:hypothetical protein